MGEALDHIEEFIAWMRSKERDFVLVGDGDELGPDAEVEVRKLDVNELETVVSAAVEDHKDFLEAAERAVHGWRRANTRQIESIGRLMDKLREKDATNRALAEKLDEVVRILVMWREMGPELGMDPDRVLEIKRRLDKAIST